MRKHILLWWHVFFFCRLLMKSWKIRLLYTKFLSVTTLEQINRYRLNVILESFATLCWHLLAYFDIGKKSDVGEGTILLDDLPALWCASPLYIAKYYQKEEVLKVIRGRTQFNTVLGYTRFPLVLRVSAWFNPKSLTPWVCYALRQRNKFRYANSKITNSKHNCLFLTS